MTDEEWAKIEANFARGKKVHDKGRREAEATDSIVRFLSNPLLYVGILSLLFMLK